jgi:hypothetical protein
MKSSSPLAPSLEFSRPEHKKVGTPENSIERSIESLLDLLNALREESPK